MRALFLLVLLLSSSLSSNATHIIGGEIHYEYLGNDNYKVVVKVYRDCYNGLVGFDDPLPLGAFNPDGLFQVFYLYLNSINVDTIHNGTLNACAFSSTPICVEQAVYELTINLPSQYGPYTIVYQRCCRPASIENLFDSANIGSTYTAFVPSPSYNNSDPYFNLTPPVVICAGQPLSFDHSATDLDGDDLVYSFCEPYLGADATNSLPDPPSDPPYSAVTFISPYTYSNPLGGSPPLSIDPTTGLLTGTPTDLGQFAVAVCVKEYRDGTFLSEHRRDFVFNVLQYNKVENIDNSGINVFPNPSSDFIYVEAANTQSVTIKLFNVAGELIKSEKVTLQSNTPRVIDISECTVGVYFLHIITNSKATVQTVLKKP